MLWKCRLPLTHNHALLQPLNVERGAFVTARFGNRASFPIRLILPVSGVPFAYPGTAGAGVPFPNYPNREKTVRRIPMS